MKSTLHTMYIGVLTLLIALSTIEIGWSQSIVTAQIGIQVQSNGDTKRAKGRNRVKVGDGVRLYVTPTEDAYLYILRTNRKEVVALNQPPYTVAAKTPVILPSQTGFYNIDGSSKHESFIVVCSPTPLKEVQDLIESPKRPYTWWAATEQSLVEKSRIQLTETVKKPFSIAGVVRSLNSDSEFLKQLPTFSGNTLVVKKYDFTVKK